MKRHLFIIPVLALAFSSAVFADSSTDTDFNLNIDSVLSLTANVSEVPINITPTPAGAFSHNSVTLTASTNNLSGYTLTMSTNSAETKLSHLTRPDSIASIDSNTNLTNFPNNKWGYSLDFSDYKIIPALANPDTIDSTTTPFNQRSTTVDFGAKANQELASGSYQNTVTFSAVVNYVEPPHQNLLPSLTSMQDTNLASVCENTYKPTKDATETVTTQGIFSGDKVPEATLTDTRDGKTYVVRKLADGNCWMSQNLALSPNGSTTYTEADTDLHDGRTFQAPAASSIGTTWNSDGSDGAHYLNPQAGYEYFQNGTTASSTGQPTESAGNYYDWPMATAGARDASGNSLIGQNSGEAVDSICPKGWRLPQKEGNRSYHNLLFTNYNLSDDSESATKLLLSPLSFIRAGSYGPGSGSFGGRGAVNLLWSSTVRDSNDAYILYFGDGGVYPQYSSSRGGGGSVRCVVR